MVRLRHHLDELQWVCGRSRRSLGCCNEGFWQYKVGKLYLGFSLKSVFSQFCKISD